MESPTISPKIPISNCKFFCLFFLTQQIKHLYKIIHIIADKVFKVDLKLQIHIASITRFTIPKLMNTVHHSFKTFQLKDYNGSF